MNTLYRDLVITVNPVQYSGNGGQHVSLPKSGVVASCDDIEVVIMVECHRSRIKNQDLAVTLVQLAIDDFLGK